MADTKAAAKPRSITSPKVYGAKYDKAVACLTKDRSALLAFYDFPRSTGSICARPTRSRARLQPCHRTIRSKGCLSNKTALAMVYKSPTPHKKTGSSRRSHQLPKLIQGVKFTDRIEVISPQTQAPPDLLRHQLSAIIPVQDLLLSAKHLFVAAMVGNCRCRGLKMSNGTASALNSERDLASIPMAQGGPFPPGDRAASKAPACRWPLS